MNVLEKYIDINKQFIILINGITGTSKTTIAKLLCNIFNKNLKETKLKLIKLSSYLINDKYVDIEINNNLFKIYDHPDNYDLNKLNEDINKYKYAIIVGNYIDTSKINFKYDISFYLDTSYINYKTYIIERDLIKNSDIIDDYVYKIFKPLCEKYKLQNKYNKIENIKNDTMSDDILMEFFNRIMSFIQKNIK